MTDDLILGTQAAAMIGKTPTTVYKYARLLGVGRKIGPVWLFTTAEVERIRQAVNPGIGRPVAEPAGREQ